MVKCQNMKTNEIVAVKVVKNKPAYFNQSMMEVTILELVRPLYLPQSSLSIRSSSTTSAIPATNTISCDCEIPLSTAITFVSFLNFFPQIFTNSSNKTNSKV